MNAHHKTKAGGSCFDPGSRRAVFFNRSPHTSVLCCMSLGTVLWRLPTPFRVMSPTAPKQPSWNCGGSGGSWNRKTNILRVISPRIPCNLGWSWMILHDLGWFHQICAWYSWCDVCDAWMRSPGSSRVLFGRTSLQNLRCIKNVRPSMTRRPDRTHFKIACNQYWAAEYTRMIGLAKISFAWISQSVNMQKSLVSGHVRGLTVKKTNL